MSFDVNPPRASSGSKAVPQELRSSWYRFHFALDRNWELLRSGNLRDMLGMRIPMPRFGLAHRQPGEGLVTNIGDWLSLVVAGLLQFRHGERIRGMVFFGVYAALLLVLLLYAGQPVAGIAQGLMFAWHLLAIMDAMQVQFETLGERMRSTVVVGFLLGCAVYLPATWIVSRVALPISINATMGVFQAGDVLLVNQIAAPEVGEYALYDLTTRRWQNQGQYGNIAYQLQGQRISRVVATEGQSVAIQDGILTVDGKASPWQPILKLNFAARSIPAGFRFILPDTLGVAGNQINTDLYLSLSIVSTKSIQGTVYYRTHPFARMTSL